MKDLWFLLNLNPEPWRVGPMSVGRKKQGSTTTLYPIVGQDQQLSAYQDAVRDELGNQEYVPGEVKLTFYFWREQANYSGSSAKQIQKHQVDATNMQKATEDALQGVFFENDSIVRDVRSVVVEQGPEVRPCIVIHVEQYVGYGRNKFPSEVPTGIVLEYLESEHQKLDDNNVWPPV